MSVFGQPELDMLECEVMELIDSYAQDTLNHKDEYSECELIQAMASALYQSWQDNAAAQAHWSFIALVLLKKLAQPEITR